MSPGRDRNFPCMRPADWKDVREAGSEGLTDGRWQEGRTHFSVLFPRSNQRPGFPMETD